MNTETVIVPAGYGRLFQKIADRLAQSIEAGEGPNLANYINADSDPQLRDKLEQSHDAYTKAALRNVHLIKQIEDLL